MSLCSSCLFSLFPFNTCLAVIIVSEIGDKTFLLAALLAMRHPRSLVFLGAFFALLLMSCLSAALGHVLPALVPRRHTILCAAALFWVFGAKMLNEGLAMEGGTGKVEEEMKEVEEELRVKDELANGPDLESSFHSSKRQLTSLSQTSSTQTPSKKKANDFLGAGLKNLLQLLISPILLQTFVMTFLAEWGDRSQISTIALAAAHNVYLVTFGTVLGHSLCTLVAVLGGRWLATKISVKHVTLGGGALFLVFGILYTYEGIMWDEAAEALKTMNEVQGVAVVAGLNLEGAAA